MEEAYAHFDTVAKRDPRDPHTWYQKGDTHPLGKDSPEAKKCFEEALRLDPNFNSARYAIAQHPHEHDPARSKPLLDEHKALKDANWENEFGLKYTEMGKYAEVIGRRPAPARPAAPLPMFESPAAFRVTLAAGARWAANADLGADPLGRVRGAIRARFGAAIVLLDYNRDDRPDIFLPGAVVEGGRVRNLLLRNDDNLAFTDVTAEAGLAAQSAALGAAAADFDNDGDIDLFVTGAGESRLYRNTAGKFEDVTERAGLKSLTGFYLGSGWLDLDQDGDSDLIVVEYATDAPSAAARLLGQGKGGGLAVFLNVGEALPARPNERPGGLTVAFQRADKPPALLPRGAVTGVAAFDADGDRDVDLVVLTDDAAPSLVLNDRLLRFRGAGGVVEGTNWNGAMVLDVNHDERSDLFLVAAGQAPQLLLSREAWEGEPPEKAFTKGVVNSPPLSQAQAIDLDLDGWTDVVAVAGSRRPALLHNDGNGRLVQRHDAFGLETDVPVDLLALAAVDLDGDCAVDVLLWSETDGLRLRRSQGNGNRAVRLELTGRRDRGTDLRTNNDAIGARVIVQAGTLWTGLENTTLSTGLGQSRVPLTLGIGKAAQADVVRVRWPDGVPQAELNIATCRVVRIPEVNRKGTSCPILLVWDGDRFRCVTDFLGGGALGEASADGSVRPPRPEESVKIEAAQMVPKDGQYLLKIAEPMDELLYLDRVQLLALDHPIGVSVYPDERFVTSGPPPSQDLLVFPERVFPVQATDHRSRDVTDVLRERDRRFVDGFATRSWLGYAEEHFVELDFGDRLAKVKPGERLFLMLGGWTDYPYPESIYAASQAGVPLKPPVLERLGEDGKWKALGELGFPAGLPKVMTREVTGLLDGPRCVVRLRTNMQVYWDQIYAAPLAEVATPERGQRVRVTPLEPTHADLASRGFMQEVRPDGKPPVAYDDGRTEPVAVTPWQGRFTRLGDVTELLRQTDDCFVLCGPGDEVTVRFDASRLPPLPAGWERSFVLRSWGYCKDTGPFTLSGGRVEPLPFRGMGPYPDGAQKNPDPRQAEYHRRWNTRPAGR